jgi:hypothetical protein
MLSKPSSYVKAIIAGLGAGGGALLLAADDGDVVAGDWWKILGALVVTFAATYKVSNAEPSSP